MGGGGGDGAVTDGVESSKIEGGDAAAVTVNVRCSNGTKFSVQVSLESSVESFKSVLEQNCDIPAGQQRLIYKGRILKDDQTLKSYGLEAEHTVHLVRGFVSATSTPAGGAPTRATTTPPAAGEVGSVEGGALGGTGLGASPFPGLNLGGLGGLGGNGGGMFGAGLPELEQMQQQLTQNPNMMREIMDLPLVQNLLNNPDVMRNMMMNNPQMRDIIDRNPELGHMLNDPAILRQTMEAARNPELMREMMRNTDRAMSNIESSPEGFNMLRRMYENVQEPFLNATTMGGGDTTNDLNSNPFAALLGTQGAPARGQVANPTTTGTETTTGSPAPNTNPLPNPWAAGGGGTNPTNPAATNPAGIGRTPPVGGLGGLGVPGLEGLFGGTTPDPNSMSQLMQNPAISQMMQSLLSNPQYMNQILGLNPQMRSMLESNPQLREMMQNPDFLRQLTSPETMQQMMTLQQSLLSGPGRQQPTWDAGQTGGATGAPNNMNLDMLMNMFGGLGTGGFTAPNTSNVPPEELYATQLTQLQEMGFFDTRENLQALTATRGNVHAAVERLLGNLGQ